jgi:hypothetical protein
MSDPLVAILRNVLADPRDALMQRKSCSLGSEQKARSRIAPRPATAGVHPLDSTMVGYWHSWRGCQTAQCLWCGSGFFGRPRQVVAVSCRPDDSCNFRGAQVDLNPSSQGRTHLRAIDSAVSPAAAPYRASGLVLWHLADVVVSPNVCLAPEGALRPKVAFDAKRTWLA